MTETSALPASDQMEPTDAGSIHEQIQRCLADATPNSAAQLADLARSTPEKETRKAARRALYLLGQRGVFPPPDARRTVQPEPRPARTDTMRAWASAYDGAGNRLFLLILQGADGGAATVVQLLANDELGIRDVSVERKREREITPLLERLESWIDDGLAIAEIEPDTARRLIDRFRRINYDRNTTTPAGFLDLLPRIGRPTLTEDESPLNDPPADDDVSESAEVGREPEDFFKLTWFEPWFFAVEDVIPWLERWIKGENSSIVTLAKTRQDIKRAVAQEAATTLVTDRVRRLYIRRLEESADVLRRRGRLQEARLALFHARALEEGAHLPAGDIPFAEALAARTLEAAAEMVARERQVSEGENADQEIA